MKKYELEYKMKKGKEINEISRAKILKKVINTSNDEFLQSAEQFYRKNAVIKRQIPANKYHPHLQLNLSGTVDGNQPSKTTRGSNSRITPDNLKRSLELDFNNNLQHWRKEAFKYQELVFSLERKNSQLAAENANLKYELKTKQSRRYLDLSNPEKEIGIQKLNYEKKIKQLERQLSQKVEKIQELQKRLIFLTEKSQKQSIRLKQNQNNLTDNQVLELSQNKARDIQKVQNGQKRQKYHHFSTTTTNENISHLIKLQKNGKIS